MAIQKDSRYQYCRAYKDDDGNWFLETPAPFRFSSEVDNVAHVVGDADTLPLLAYRFFREMDRPSRFWRAIAEFNDIIDATELLETGKTLVIPSPRWLESKFLAPTDEYRELIAELKR